jgi:4-oxalocrotonate tautomerase family enzyme
MPTLEVYLPQGHADERKATLISGLTRATVIAGRTGAQKEALIAHLSETSASILETPLDATRVMIKEIPNTDFGIGGQTARALGR